MLERQTLRRLLTWMRQGFEPNLAVVLVDADGHSSRQNELLSIVADLPATKVVCTSIQEFEAWLIADVRVVSTVLGMPFPDPGPPEKLEPRRAKEILTGAITSSPSSSPKAVRMALAQKCSLDETARRCEAFRGFMRDLARAVPQ